MSPALEALYYAAFTAPSPCALRIIRILPQRRREKLLWAGVKMKAGEGRERREENLPRRHGGTEGKEDGE
jgi:hypothetical protein